MAQFTDGCHHQVKWEWMSQIELVWVKVRVEWECFWVNMREDNKVSEFKMAVCWIQNGRIQDGCHHQVESEWMSEVFSANGWGGKCEWSFFCANGGNQCWQLWVSLRGKTKRVESKMANSRWQNSRWLPSSSCVRINRWSSFCAKWLDSRCANSRWLTSSS